MHLNARKSPAYVISLSPLIVFNMDDEDDDDDDDNHNNMKSEFVLKYYDVT